MSILTLYLVKVDTSLVDFEYYFLHNLCSIIQSENILSKESFSMTIKELKSIINSLPDETYALIDLDDKYTDIETVITEHHSDGRTHIIFSAVE